ncbi:hypothetical protein GH714_024072 [Hevea brasiliensis]|uniref:Conserved oligomeric Golgi complex subunit 2 n=1 Tax=Hevea brasiliensis TaxID=3981 RepID=A0A6A6MEY7_HEVBR|nr:hypothetical protein GH714_024072 [Hevea brasiliensis]
MVDSMSTPPPRAANDLFSDPLDTHPLWFKPNLFLSPTFDTESYISELRTFVPFDTLRTELQAHLASLSHELIDLINRDYADFVNLSTKLVDVDAAVVRMRAPLLELREKIEGFRGSLEGSLVALRNGLQQRSEAAGRERLYSCVCFVWLIVEKLIKELPSVPADWSNGDLSSSIKNAMSNGTSLQPVESGTNLRETQSMLLERIASEMNRLKFYMAHTQNLSFIENMEKRIQSASLLLDASLGHCFVDGLEHRDENAIYDCLRAYAAIDNTKSAEEIFRTTIVAPLICKIFPHGPSGMVAGVSGDGLENDYHQIKQCIQKDCKFLLEISSAGYCPSRSSVAKFRGEVVYAEFMKQWNIGVYFSLRFQEIAGALDSALAATSLVLIQNSHSGRGNLQDLSLKQSATLLESLRSCWREDVHILLCSDKFLRLSLQLLASLSFGYEWAVSAVPDDFVYIIHDITYVATEVCGGYLDHVLQCLSSCSPDILDLVKQSILQGGKSLNDLAPLAINAIIEVLVDKAVEDLRQVKGITATYRMTNKPLPLRHSPYVSGVLRPLKVSYLVAIFMDLILQGFSGWGASYTYLTKETRSELLLCAATEITGHYYELAAELVSVARKTESSLQRIRQGAQRRAGASLDVSDQSVSDTDKICMQLFLDIQEHGRNLIALGIEQPTFQHIVPCGNVLLLQISKV